MFNEQYKKEKPLLGLLGTGGGLGYLTGDAGTTILALAHEGSPYVSVYKWDGGFGTKYANPSTLPPGNLRGMDWHPEANAIALGGDSSPYINAYSWDMDTGFGSKYSNPSTLPPSGGRGCSFSPDGNYLAFAHEQSPTVTVWNWSSGFGSKVSNPSTNIDATSCDDVEFSPNGSYIGIAGRGTQVQAYGWSNGWGGTRYLSAGCGGQINNVSWHPDSNVLAAAHFGNTGQSAFAYSGSGFGSKYSDPSGQTNNAWAIQFHPDGDAIVVGHTVSPYVSAWAWSNGWGSKYSNPSTAILDTGFGLGWTADGKDLAVGFNGSPYVHVYAWSSGFGSKYANPSTLPTGRVWKCKFLTV
jgi:WD40 repeat protein